ncbi:MAG TPA: FecR domain-containing protein, partial [Caulobacteraceae bacterium]|nr:FecR domain-containing protein [Caulobacteraceae bacterium]
MARYKHQAVMEEASALFARSQSNAADRSEIEAWLDADPANAAAYARVEAAWERSDRLKALSADHVAEVARPALLPTRRWAAGLALAMLGAGGAGVAWLARPRAIRGTALGERRVVALEDGSRVELNTDSRIEVAYAEDQRRIVLLKGEALFEVAKDPSRPFVVMANGAEVRAIGTAFNIRLREKLVELTVTEGVVSVKER